MELGACGWRIRNTEHGQISPRRSRLCLPSPIRPPPTVTVISPLYQYIRLPPCPLATPTAICLCLTSSAGGCEGEDSRICREWWHSTCPSGGGVVILVLVVSDGRSTGCAFAKDTVTAHFRGPQRKDQRQPTHRPPTHTHFLVRGGARGTAPTTQRWAL